MQKTQLFNGDAFAVFQKFADKKGLFFLDSSLKSKEGARSFIGFDPIKIVVGKDVDALRQVIAWQQRRKSLKAVGYITYEGHVHFGLYDQWLDIDHAAKKMIIHAPTPSKLNAIKKGTDTFLVAKSSALKKVSVPFLSNFNKQSYVVAVKAALAAIKRGDIYQINLSRFIQANVQVDPVALYGALRELSPSPFAAFYDTGTGCILSSSPERFLKLDNGIVTVRPMKGTRPRGKTPQQDQKLFQDLKQSPKEIAELLMVTDLERNDLGRVCDYGSVKVTALRTIERYKTVFQATATVEGRLRKDRNAVDLIKATFPSGSVTGCPKIEAMKIIKKIEKAPRGFYTGALGYIDPSGNMDFSVLIRSMLVKDKSVRYHVGGGIVADSNPVAEYAETTLKAQAMEKAIREVLRA